MYDAEEREKAVHELSEENEKTPVSYRVVLAGKQARLSEFCGGRPSLGGCNNAKGRGKTPASPEQQAKNLKKKERKTFTDSMDITNTNFQQWRSFDTFTNADEVRSADVLIERFQAFKKRVNYHYKKRYGDTCVFNYNGHGDFQDGKRRNDKNGRYSLHLHLLTNLGYAECQTIICENVYAGKKGVKNRRYLQQDGTWSKLANGDSVFFCGWDTPQEQQKARQDAHQYLQEHKEKLLQSVGKGKVLKVKKMPFLLVLWGHGTVDQRWFGNFEKDARKSANGDAAKADAGFYMAGCYQINTIDLEKLTPEERGTFKGKSMHFHSQFETTKEGEIKRPGGLKRPEVLYNDEGIQKLQELGAWDCLTKVKSFFIENEEEDAGDNGFEVGHIVTYKFFLDVAKYPKLKTLSLDNREAFDLSEDVFYMTLAVDRERERRECEEKQRERAPAHPEPEQDAWWQPSFDACSALEYSGAYQQLIS